MLGRRLVLVFAWGAGIVVACGGTEHSDLFSSGGTAAGGSSIASGAGGASTASSTSSGTTTGGITTTATTGAGGSNPAGSTVSAGGAGGASAGSGGASGPGAGGSFGTGQGGSSAGAGGAPDGGTTAAGGAAGSAGKAGAGGGSGDAGVNAMCTSNDACQAGLFCKKAGCSVLTTLGKCTARPTVCSFSDAPVCGCDGITYLNACLADMNGQNFSVRAICGDTALKCTPGGDTCQIRPNGYCAVILADRNACAIGQTQEGKCWVVAADCVETGTHYDSCDGSQRCIHSCDVAKSEKPYFPDPLCGG